LKTLEKINRKGNRNSRKKEKAISAQASPISPARACAPLVSDRRVPPVGANQRAHSSLSLSVPWARPIDSVSLARARSLSLYPAVPTCQLVLNLSPTISPPWSRPRPHVLRPHPSSCAPFEPRFLLAHLPSLICALYPTLSPSLSLCPREHGTPPPPTDAHCLFHGRRRARAPSSATVSSALLLAARDTLRCALSLPAASGPHSPEHFLRSRSPPPSPHRTLAPPPLLRDASASA
jgi:hypothetical protein